MTPAVLAFVVVAASDVPVATIVDGAATAPAPAVSRTARLPAGPYRLDVDVEVVTHITVLGTQRTRTKTVSLVVVDEAGVATARACSVETRGASFTSRFPARAIRALPTSRFPILLDGDTVHADMGEGQVGWVGSGPLPMRSDDPRVVDSDGNGKPGVALDLDLGSLGVWPLEIVSRGHSVLHGMRTPDGAAGRLSRVESEESILSGLPITLPPRNGPVPPEQTSFVLRRVDATTCEALLGPDDESTGGSQKNPATGVVRAPRAR